MAGSVAIQHVLVDACECRGELDSASQLVAALRAAAAACRAVERGRLTEEFVPHGVTSVLVLGQSHIVISTWPEFAFATVDIALCGPGLNPDAAWSVIADTLKPGRVHLRRIERGA